MYNKHFVCLIFVSCRNPRKLFNINILHMKKFDTKIYQIMVYQYATNFNNDSGWLVNSIE